jgi:hypothetical protein
MWSPEAATKIYLRKKNRKPVLLDRLCRFAKVVPVRTHITADIMYQLYANEQPLAIEAKLREQSSSKIQSS